MSCIISFNLCLLLRYYCYFFSIEEETEAERDEVSCSGSHSLVIERQDLKFVKSLHCNNTVLYGVCTYYVLTSLIRRTIGIGELEKAVLNLGFCKGAVTYENKEVR